MVHPRRTVLLLDSLQRVGWRLLPHGQEFRHAALHVLRCVPCVVHHVPIPWALVEGVLRKVEARCRDHGRQVSEEIVVQQCELAQKLREHIGGVIRPCDGGSNFEKALEEDLWGCYGEDEVQLIENPCLHPQDLIAGVGVVRDVHELVHGRWMDLLVLRGDEHTGDADELQLSAVHGTGLQEAVDVVHGEVECLRHKPVLLSDLHEPIDEDATHGGVDVLLTVHVVHHHAHLQLDVIEVIVDVVHVGSAQLRVGAVHRVDIYNLWLPLRLFNRHRLHRLRLRPRLLHLPSLQACQSHPRARLRARVYAEL
mmetsp:Transcript_17104/g.46264  ORF Transcript_17104/g.46264 Transcript_17104/m.46264 type:complete len:310 (+) Transcript_17104:562-1491(+)